MEQNELEQYIEQLQEIFLLTIRRITKKTTECEPKLTGPQFYILKLLHTGGKSTVSGLAEEMAVKPSAITAMIDRLLKQEYVSRERDENDRRVVFIQITDTGNRILEETLQKRKKILVKYLSHLNREELESLLSIYEKISRVDIKE